MPSLKNEQHEKYCQAIAKGMTSKDAFLAAYPDCKPNSARTMCSRVARMETVQQRICELRNDSSTILRNISHLTRMDILEQYSTIAKNPEETTANRMKAMESLTKMCGWNEPDEVNMNHSGEVDLIASDFVLKINQMRQSIKAGNTSETNEDPA
jgi:hypothetical protein